MLFVKPVPLVQYQRKANAEVLGAAQGKTRQRKANKSESKLSVPSAVVFTSPPDSLLSDSDTPSPAHVCVCVCVCVYVF